MFGRCGALWWYYSRRVDLSEEDVTQLPLPVLKINANSNVDKRVLPDKDQSSIHRFSPERIVLRQFPTNIDEINLSNNNIWEPRYVPPFKTFFLTQIPSVQLLVCILNF